VKIIRLKSNAGTQLSPKNNVNSVMCQNALPKCATRIRNGLTAPLNGAKKKLIKINLVVRHYQKTKNVCGMGSAHSISARVNRPTVSFHLA